MEYKIAVLKGDGIGPEIVDVTTKVLEKIGEKFNHKFIFTIFLILEGREVIWNIKLQFLKEME